MIDKTVEDLIYLVSCAVNETVPTKERIDRMNLNAVFQHAKRHLLTAAAAVALESAGVRDNDFVQEMAKAIRKAVLMDAEARLLFEKLEGANIKYMPLKGTMLKDDYPVYGMRQMADRDILIDESRAGEVKALMEGMGFETEHYGKGVHDCYHKKPVSNFEIHRALFADTQENGLWEYYRDVWKRLSKVEGSSCRYQFEPEDFYVYMIAHEYKHYSGGGTGLRSLLDTYVYTKEHTLDMDYIAVQMEKLGIMKFEEDNRSLAMHLFTTGEMEGLTDADREMLDYILSSGTYGTMRHMVENQIARRGRWGYLWSRAFLPYKLMVKLFPVLKTFPVLLPFCWVARLVSASITRRRTVWYQLKAVLWKK